MAQFQVENQWGGTSAPWHPGGVWALGSRFNQAIVALDVTSSDGGKTFTGTCTYANEGPIGFKGELSGPNTYAVQNQWGGSSAPWHPGGVWILGGRDNQSAVAVNVASRDGGQTFSGTMTYAGEGPIGFKASPTDRYQAQNQWGGSTAPWHPGGAWTLGSRGDSQLVVAVDVASSDGGKTFTGTCTYAGEGPIGFKASQTSQNEYAVQNQWGGSSAPWHPGGIWIIGARGNQNAVELKITSPDGGRTLNGTTTYAGEGPIGFKSTRA
jgi:hypothetical protein